jgi:hypothetical protein
MGKRKKWGKRKKGEKQEKNKKIHELQLRFSYRLFGMSAEANLGGALADITVTTSYRGTSLVGRGGDRDLLHHIW